jgi:hypothetical protein
VRKRGKNSLDREKRRGNGRVTKEGMGSKQERRISNKEENNQDKRKGTEQNNEGAKGQALRWKWKRKKWTV